MRGLHRQLTGGTPTRDTAHETYSATLKCHDTNGEIYMVTFGPAGA